MATISIDYNSENKEVYLCGDIEAIKRNRFAWRYVRDYFSPREEMGRIVIPVMDEEPLNFEGANGLWYDFLPNISDEKKAEFQSPKLMDVIPEISSRFSCNACIIQNIESGEKFVLSDWIPVQNQRYSYNVILNESGGVSVKMIILDFLYCKVDFE